ncbi:SWI/SNF-related matrix-associated actin-dependent regulator [Spatholobus suberectus]|nr:SWI/SNF-related matrix-associated actin-dependent regulator [Spatholobus suberectus]
MSLRRFFGYSDDELMRPNAKTCSRLMRHTAAIYTVGGALGFWVLCRMQYGPRITIPRSLRWAACGV